MPDSGKEGPSRGQLYKWAREAGAAFVAAVIYWWKRALVAERDRDEAIAERTEWFTRAGVARTQVHQLERDGVEVRGNLAAAQRKIAELGAELADKTAYLEGQLERECEQRRRAVERAKEYEAAAKRTIKAERKKAKDDSLRRQLEDAHADIRRLRREAEGHVRRFDVAKRENDERADGLRERIKRLESELKPHRIREAAQRAAAAKRAAAEKSAASGPPTARDL